MINSMTGFGSAVLTEKNTRVKAELKSVNHRFFELSFSMPHPLGYLEQRIKKQIHNHFQRGSFSLSLSVDGNEVVAPKLHMNWTIVDQYIAVAEKIKERSGTGRWDIGSILSLPGIFTLEEADSDAVRTLEPIVLEVIGQACDRLADMRRKEGGELRTDILGKAETVAACVSRLAAEAPKVRQKYADRLHNHVETFLSGHQAIDEDRLMTEVAVYADKSSIDEELTRMRSHLFQFRGLLSDASGAEPVGRRLDFLVQEMNREMNTVGSKAASAEMTRIVVQAKNEIEKLREQIQNVE